MTSTIRFLFNGFMVGLLMLGAHTAWAGGCFSTTPAGECVKWDQNQPVVWRPESGPLKGPDTEGELFDEGGGGCSIIPEAHAIDVSNAQAISIINEAFDVWKNVPNSSIDIQQGSSLGDVNFSNVENFWIGDFITGETTTVDAEGCYNPASGKECLNPILFDHSGLMTQAIQGQCAHCSILGFAAILPQTNNDPPQNTISSPILKSSQAVVSGACLEPAVVDPFCGPCCPSGIDLDTVKGTMVHELGHYLGLDHTLTNKTAYEACISEGGCTPNQLAQVPTMISLFVSGANLSTLTKEDEAWFAWMYPGPNFSTQTCSISGSAFLSGGTNTGRCLEVVAEKAGVADNEKTVSTVAGAFSNRVTQGIGGQSGTSGKTVANCDGSVASCGAYLIPGLEPGNYTIKVQTFNTTSQAERLGFILEPCTPTLPGPGGGTLDNPTADVNVVCTAGVNTPNTNVNAN